MAIRDLTRLLLCFLHAGSEKTHQLPLFNDGQLTAGKHVGSAAGHLSDRQVTERQEDRSKADSRLRADRHVTGTTAHRSPVLPFLGDRSVFWWRFWILHSDWHLTWWADQPKSHEKTWAGKKQTRENDDYNKHRWKPPRLTVGCRWRSRSQRCCRCRVFSSHLWHQVNVEPSSFLQQLTVANPLLGWLWLVVRLMIFWLLLLFLGNLCL